MVYVTRKNLWMDVEGGWRGWFKTPLTGADSSPQGWGADGTLLNGGGYAVSSFGSHKQYQYEWGESSSRQEAQFMKSLADGTYGRGLIHFIEPTLYDQNILPARTADPSMAIEDEGSSFVYGYNPTPVPTSNWEQNLLPITSAFYDLANESAGYRGIEDSTYVTIPEGYTLYLGAFYQATGSGGIFIREVLSNGREGRDIMLTPIDNESPVIAVDTFSGIRGVRIWLGKYATGAASVTATALIARLISTDRILIDEAGYAEGEYGLEPYGGVLTPTHIDQGPWIGGMGHSGCKFVGKPSFVSNTGVNGGQVGFAATFKEVGSYLYG